MRGCWNMGMAHMACRYRELRKAGAVGRRLSLGPVLEQDAKKEKKVWGPA